MKKILSKKQLSYLIVLLIIFSLIFLNIISNFGILLFLFLLTLNKSSEIKIKKFFIFAGIGLLLFFTVEENLKLELFLIIIYFLVLNQDFEISLSFFKKIKKLTKNIKDVNYLFFLILIVVFTQNSFLEFETIDWDINSYLVASQNVNLQNLPYDTQWESKQPLFFYFYKLFIWISGANLVIFKIVNDLFIISNVFVIYFISKKLLKNRNSSFLAACFYLLLMSPAWATAEYSELYSLYFISLTFLITFFNKEMLIKYFFAGLFLSISMMINIGTVVFLPMLYLMFDRENYKTKNLIGMILGLALPVLLVSAVYFKNNLFQELIYTTFVIPASYPSASIFEPNMLIDFIRGYFKYNLFLFLYLVFTIYNITINFNKLDKKLVFPLISSLLFVLIASHGYYHHFIFLIFFLSICSYQQLKSTKNNLIVVIFMISFLSVVIPSSSSSFHNLINHKNLQENYPLYKISKQIIEKENKNKLTVLSVDYHLVNFYLGINNFSYIVHPTNHNEKFITENLIKLGKIQVDELSYLINEKKPKYILCSQNFENFNCEVSDWVVYPNGKKVYEKVNLTKLNESQNIHYYKDPYKSVRLFVKTNELDN